MKKALKWVGIGFVVLVIVGIFASGNNKGGAGDVAGTQQAEAKQSTPQKEIVRVSVQQLFDDYEANEVAADEKLKGKIIEVTGTVQSIDKDFTDSIVVTLRTSNEFMPGRMAVPDSQKQQAMALKKGAKVVMRCEKMSRIVGSPAGRDCVIL